MGVGASVGGEALAALDAASGAVRVLGLVLGLVLVLVLILVVVGVEPALAEHTAVPEQARARRDAERVGRVTLARLDLGQRRKGDVRGGRR